MKSLEVYNTLHRKKEKFNVDKDKTINFYTCGPTVYNYIHIGNARPYVFFDVVRRYLEKIGYDINYIVNITDIDDKIINKANNQNVSFKKIAEKFSKEYIQDLKMLKVEIPDYMPKATDTIPDMIKFIKKLEKKGFTYTTDDGVYFRIDKFESYGKLSNKKIEDLKSGSRVAVNEDKENPLDFALWKFSKPDEPSWESPWGKGRPGWHIECSTMGMKYSDNSLDMHAGGEDLIFPHHENEIAQSEAATGKQFAKYWLHNAYVNIEGMKMSKSLGNFKTVRDLLEKYPPEIIRLFLLSTHYRKILDYNDSTIENAIKKYERISNFMSKVENIEAEPNEIYDSFDKRVKNRMNNDFNTPGAIGVLMEAIKEANKKDEDENILAGVKYLLKDWNMIFSIIPERKEDFAGIEDELINLLIKVREKERDNKNFEIADYIRDRLDELGIVLEDAPEGTRFKKKYK